jgi:hypothetical protein
MDYVDAIQGNKREEGNVGQFTRAEQRKVFGEVELRRTGFM